jgi:hypothetical protein
MKTPRTVGFHESSIVCVRREGSVLTIELEGVHKGNDVVTVAVRLAGIKSITRDGTTLDDLPDELEGGEVLTLEYTETTLQLVGEWTNFNTHESKTHSFGFTFESLALELHTD